MTDHTANAAESALQARADLLVNREVQLCLSSMVSTLAQGYGALDSSTADLSSLAEQAMELCTPGLDYEESARGAGFVQDSVSGCWSDKNGDGYATAEQACAENEIDGYEWEVFEHWAVSTWLAEKLQAAGERVDTDFAGLNVWARTTTGQAISMDAIIRTIVTELHAPAPVMVEQPVQQQQARHFAPAEHATAVEWLPTIAAQCEDCEPGEEFDSALDEALDKAVRRGAISVPVALCLAYMLDSAECVSNVESWQVGAMVEQPCQQQQGRAPAMSEREATATRASIARLRTKADAASNPIDASRLNASADRLGDDRAAAKVAPVEASDPRAPLADELALLGRLIGTDDPQGKAQMRGIVERARRETVAMMEALRFAELTIAGTLAARGYQPGSCVDEWAQVVRNEVAALPPIRSAINATAGMVPQPVQQQQARHGFQAVQVEGPGREAILDTFTVTKRCTADAAYHAADALCDQARAMPHKPTAFVREVNAPGEDDVSDAAYRSAAKASQIAGDGIEIDEDAKVSRSESGGAYVAAWVWVSDDEARA